MSERRLVILPRSDTYESFEQPQLDDARATELAAAEDIPGLRRLLLDRARGGHEPYDVVALGGYPGSLWEYVGQASLEGSEEPVPVQRLRRTAIDPSTALWFTIGNEFNPGDPFGRVALTIDDQDRVTLEHYSRQGNATYTAELGDGVLDEIRQALADGGFPQVPQHQVPAGAAIRQLELVTDGEPVSASMYDDFGKTFDGYRDAFAILDSLTLQLTGHAEHDQLKTPVSNIEKVA